MLYQIIDFEVHGNSEGNLIALESFKEIPFEIKRVYYIYGTPKNITRGKHAHKKLEQVIVCVSGSCDFIFDNGEKREKVTLDSPNKGIYIKNNIWREFTNFSSNCVIMVLASELYSESDYIRNYDDFISIFETDD